jgi:hypothetical protein
MAEMLSETDLRRLVLEEVEMLRQAQTSHGHSEGTIDLEEWMTILLGSVRHAHRIAADEPPRDAYLAWIEVASVVVALATQALREHAACTHEWAGSGRVPQFCRRCGLSRSAMDG